MLHAATTVPYWRDQFETVGLDPRSVRTLADLSPLPLLDRAGVVGAAGRLISTAVPARQRVRQHTGGTTGAGLVFWTTWDSLRDQEAVWWRHRRRHGIPRGTWFAQFTGQPIIAGPRHSPPYWHVNRTSTCVLYSVHHLSPRTAPAYLRDLAGRALPWFHGFPSFLASLAQEAVRRGVELRPAWVSTGAENLLTWQRDAIREAFGAEPFQHYGLSEGVANASQCPEGLLHVDEDYAAVEFIPNGDGTHAVAGTNLSNEAMPFIRYVTDDIAVLAEGCDCGLPGRPIASIDGRMEDTIELSDGSRVGMVEHLFWELTGVAEAQVRQHEPGRCTISLVPRLSYTDHERTKLLAESRMRFGDRLDVEIQLVDSIPRTARGKLRLVVRD
ncbi:MAG: phenylacetate--CoA ligase family protein [Dehalococcoidia bacterium]